MRPAFVECARELAKKTLQNGGKTDAERLEYAFRRCLARKPAASESQVLLALCEKQKRKLSAPDAKAKAADVDLAAWTIVARALLNLDETITKE